MACYKPIKAYYTPDGRVVFSESKNETTTNLHLSCGQCIGCKLERARQWSIRIMCEAQLYDENSFITLTYDENHIPTNNSIKYKDFQQFMKNFRKKDFGKNIRFFMCGEYGTQTKRPHFHAAIFNQAFRHDRYPWQKSKGNQLYRSPSLEALWKHGNSNIGELTSESANYVARYMVEKITGTAAERHYRQVDETTGEITYRTPEFIQMSRRPGIGANWLKLYWQDVANGYYTSANGHDGIAPKYFRRYFKNHDKRHDINDYLQEKIKPEDNTPERLATREQHALLLTKQFQRNLGDQNEK